MPDSMHCFSPMSSALTMVSSMQNNALPALLHPCSRDPMPGLVSLCTSIYKNVPSTRNRLPKSAFRTQSNPASVYRGPANTGPALGSGAQFPVNDPLYLVPAMAAVTKSLTFGVTASTTYEPPYSLARKFSTVDHLSNGRVAWNIVTSYVCV